MASLAWSRDNKTHLPGPLKLVAHPVCFNLQSTRGQRIQVENKRLTYRHLFRWCMNSCNQSAFLFSSSKLAYFPNMSNYSQLFLFLSLMLWIWSKWAILKLTFRTMKTGSAWVSVCPDTNKERISNRAWRIGEPLICRWKDRRLCRAAGSGTSVGTTTDRGETRQSFRRQLPPL